MHTKYLIGILLLLRQALVLGQCANEQYYTIGFNKSVTAKVIEDVRGGFTYNMWGAPTDTVSTQIIGNMDIWVLKNDSCGKRVWKKNFGYDSTSHDNFIDAITTPDSNILVLGYGEYIDQGGIYSGTLFKITPEGEVLWKQAYGGLNGLVPMSVAYNPYRNTYIVSGRIERYLSGGLNRAYVFEVDSVGNLLQEKDIFLNEDSLQADKKMLRVPKISVSRDSTYFAVLEYYYGDQIMLLKLGSNLEEISLTYPFKNTFSNTGLGEVEFNKRTNELNFYIGGSDTLGLNRGPWIAILDSNGLLKYKWFDGDQNLARGFGLSNSDGCILAGRGIAQYDKSLNKEWVKYFTTPSNYNHFLQDIIQLRNGSYAGIGSTDAHSQNKYVEVFTMQTGIDGRFVGLIPDQTKSLPITVYPNPSQGIFSIEGITPEQTLATVWNVNGQVVFKAALTNGSINLSHQPDGLYVLQLTTSEGKLLSTQKISIIK